MKNLPGKMKKNFYRNRSHGSKSEPPSGIRLMALGIFWLLCFLLTGAKLIKVQVLEHSHYREIGEAHFKNRLELPAQRGTIFDRNGEKLAVDLMHYTAVAKLYDVSNKQKTASKLAAILHLPQSALLKKLSKSSHFVPLARRLDIETAQRIKKLGLPGIFLEKDFSRYYPFKEYGAHIIGFCDFDNRARSGLELEYDPYLRGKPGWMVVLRDARGNQYPDYEYPISPPVNGFDIVTTIDMVYQNILEEELGRVVKDQQATEGSAVLLNPETGEVLAMANYPGFDPNGYNNYPMANYKNIAISNIFEPGSTFKLIAMALALEQLNLDMDHEIVYCENGKYRLANNTIRDHKPFGYLSLRRVFENSSNIGVIKLARKFKAPLFYRYARDFGFGTPSGIDLPAETGGILHRPQEYSKVSLSYMSIGYEVGVTALQIANAYAAVANGGKLMKPFLVQKIIDANGTVVLQHTPEKIRQVISPVTSEYMKEILLGVVEEGTGQNAAIKGIAIAGKTGTAQKIDASTNRHTSAEHMASFVGFFPEENPRFVLMVILNNPRNAYYGSQVAAPAFRNIAMRIIGLPRNEIEPPLSYAESAANSEPQTVPDVQKLDLSTAEEILENYGLDYQVEGNGKRVITQDPAPDAPLDRSRPIRIFTGEPSEKPGRGEEMPKLTGLTLKEALQILSDYHIIPEVEGYGIVIQQLPKPGKKMPTDKNIKLICKPA